jgi:uncharacterized protein
MMADPDILRRAADRGERARSLRAGLAFLVLALVLTVAGMALLVHALGGLAVDHPSIGANLAGDLVLVVLSVAVPALVLARATRADAVQFGWGRAGRGRQLAIGLGSGFGAMAGLIAVLAALGAAHIGPSALPWRQIAGDGLAYAAIFALTALSEEGLFRGYVLIRLSRAIGFWPAALVTSAIFAALHLIHADETVMGLVQVFLFGLVMAIGVRWTGALWFALGFHAAWDFTETFVFGVADSGMTSAGSLLATGLTGPTWLSGGAVGPEGSMLVLPLLVLIGVGLDVLRRR